MRKHLNNPWIVATLALSALAGVAHSLWPARLGGSVPAVSVAANEADPLPAEISPAVAIAAPSSDDLTALTGTSVRRDPFAPTARSAAVATAVEKPMADLIDTAHLTALWAQDGATYAVINGSIVRPGDEIGRLKIESASADGVWLVHWKGRDHLSLGQAFTLRTPAAGPPALSPSNGAIVASSL